MTDLPPAMPPVRVYRHRLPTRLWHWLNALTLLVLLMSGLMIFNAHPRFYWGQYGANHDRAWLEIGSTRDAGYLRVGSWKVDTTGVLGRWTDGAGVEQRWAFPGWATIPTRYSLADGRRWHLSFAWLLAIALTLYMLWTAFGGHLAKDLRVRRGEWAPRHIWRDIKDHARLQFPTGEAAARYNILQKLSYIGVIFVVLPLMIFTGLAMSLGAIFNGAIIVEQVFSYPGLGRLLFGAVYSADYSLVLGVTAISIIAVAASVFLIDVLYPLFDPRVQLA